MGITLHLYWCVAYRSSGTLKIIRVKNFCIVKFSRFRSIREIFLAVDYCNMDELLESSWRLVYYTRYQESQGSLAVVVDRTFTSWSVDLRASLFTDHRRVILFFVVDPDREIILTTKYGNMLQTLHSLNFILLQFYQPNNWLKQQFGCYNDDTHAHAYI